MSTHQVQTPRQPLAKEFLAVLSLVLLVLTSILAAVPADAKEGRKERKEAKKAEQEAIAALPDPYREWIRDVSVIISDEEKSLFLALEKDYQRDAFIERFWKVRDTISRTARNEFKEGYEALLELARQFNFDARAEILLINGMPAQRWELRCSPTFWPLEAWYYQGSETTGSEFVLLFYKVGSRDNPFRLWEPIQGTDTLYATRVSASGSSIEDSCVHEDAEILRAALAHMVQTQGGVMGASVFLDKVTTPPPAPEKEWVATFSSYTTEVPEGAPTFDARFELDYPGRQQSRTVLQGAVLVPVEEIELEQLGESKSYNLMLNGEVLRGDELFENFRYKYDFPKAELKTPEGDMTSLPLVFQRSLRPGEYRLLLKVEDLNSGRFYRHEERLDVPHVETAPPPEPDDPESARLLREANAAIRSGENTLEIVPLPGTFHTGLVRVDTLVTGPDVDSVAFSVDGQPILTKRRPPWNVELDFGQTPRALTLRAEAFDDAGEEIAADELLLNAGQHRFAVRLVEPRPGKTYTESLRAQAEILLPEGEIVERVEFFLNEEPVATVYQPPYVQPILLPGGEEIAYVRALATTLDGATTEDVVFINAPDYLTNVDVDFVELYTAVLDKDKHPVEGLVKEDFTILEDDVAQTVVRFEQVRNLSIHVAVMLDVSASMDEELEATKAAALTFFEEAVTPKDRAALITFNDHPHLATKLTNDLKLLAGGLAGLKAERGTSLYDSLIFGLYYFNGIRGQRAILLLSDGKDESSRFEYDDALEYARRAGVAIYAIGLKLEGKSYEARKKLTEIAEETGGRSFFVDDENQLESIYETIQRELRSRYLLAYQSTNATDSKLFRTIEVKMSEKELEAKTLRGYYP